MKFQISNRKSHSSTFTGLGHKITVVILLSAITLCCYDLFFPDISRLLIRSPSTLYERSGKTTSLVGFSSSDSMHPSVKGNSASTKDFYVIKDGATDCSFVSALVLMLRRDPHFMSRAIKRDDDSTFLVKLPGWKQPESVTPEDLKIFYATWKSTRNWYTVLIPGHLPVELSILRCAYYRFQARTGIRSSNGVYNDGYPHYDLMYLSGNKSVITVEAVKNKSTKKVNFRNCVSIIIKTELNESGSFIRKIRNAGFKNSNPMAFFDNPERYLIIFSTVNRIPWYLKHKFIPSHAYYFLGMTRPENYILGDSYHTRRPISVSKKELGEHFRSMDFVKFSDSEAGNHQ